MYLKRMERAYCEFLYRRPGPLGALLKKGLTALSWGYSSALHLRNKAFDLGILPSKKPSNTYVVSIGNLQAGGTGKTPFTIFLAEQLGKNEEIAILSRGYRASMPRSSPTLINDQLGTKFSADYCGDEPTLLAHTIPGAKVIVGKDRVAGADYAKALGAKIILLDDGFQHRYLKRDLDIVLIDASLPDEADHPLPRGLLRERHTSLSRAHLIVITKLHHNDQFAAIKQRMAQFTTAPVVAVKQTLAKICASHDTVTKEIDSLEGSLFCGIANPLSFVQTIKNHGLHIQSQHFFPDHATYTLHTLRQLAADVKNSGASYLICTEKDAVKIAPWMDNIPLPVLWPKMRMSISHGHDTWNSFIKELKEKLLV